MASYDVFQQTFGLSMASNAVGTCIGTQANLQQTLEEKLPALLARFGPGWAPVWGPTLWKNAPEDAATGPDHSWVVLRNPAVAFEDGSVHETYVVAIAGTAKTSEYAWTDINLRVGKLVDFDAWVAEGVKNVPAEVAVGAPAVSYVSIGTALAVQKLLAIPAPAGVAGAATNLYDFFAGLGASGPSRIIFTGHSLGAALAPTLALALVKSDIIPSASVRVYMTAGPSPGNGPFVAAFSATFPPMNVGATYQVWNRNIYNTLDVVPQAWCTVPAECADQNTFNVPGMYGIPGPQDLLFLMGYMHQLIGETQVVYKPLPGRSFPGVPSGLPMPTTIEEFLFSALLQHEPPYNVYIGVPAGPAHGTLGHGVERKTTKQVFYSSAVLGDLAVLGEHIEEIKTQMANKSG